MPPRRPASIRCRFRDDDGSRCHRNGFGDPAFCRAHALAGNVDIAFNDPLVGELVDRADRFLAGHRNPLVQSFAGILGQVLAGRPPQVSQVSQVETDAPRARAQASTSRPPPPPRPAAPPPKEDPRDVLGFGPAAKLTRAMVKERQRELAKLMHPDHGGSTKALQRLNAAAQELLAGLQ